MIVLLGLYLGMAAVLAVELAVPPRVVAWHGIVIFALLWPLEVVAMLADWIEHR